MNTKVTAGRIFIGRLEHGSDLLGSLSGLCEKKRISLGVFSLVGAVQNASLAFYDQKKKSYTGRLKLRTPCEIVSCTGNVSLKDGKTFVHAHIVLSDHKGKALGGHLMEGTTVFAAEYVFQELKGIRLARTHEPVTGLSLWQNLPFK